jgi:pyruvate dehydrogenase E1 component alpha subunit
MRLEIAKMPRTEIKLQHKIEYLSVLDEDGNLDKELEPELSDALLRKLHRAMLLGRRFDERMLRLQRQGRLGTFPPIKGQEAAHLGAVAAIRPSDWFVPAFRETAAEIWRGRAMDDILVYYAGYNQAGFIPEEVRNLPMAIPVATQIPHAVGLSFGAKYSGKDEITLVFFGDGASSEGDFYESMNFAGVLQVPIVFVCQNNQWAISHPRKNQTRAETLAQKALAAGIPGIQVDGNDILASYVATSEAVERARGGGGPTLVECVTYRLSVHSTADDPKRYRSDEEVAQWEKRDPLPRFQAYLMSKVLLDESEIERLEEEVAAEIQAAVQKAEERKTELNGKAMNMFEHIFFELPPYLQEQRTVFAEYLARKETEDG